MSNPDTCHIEKSKRQRERERERERQRSQACRVQAKLADDNFFLSQRLVIHPVVFPRLLALPWSRLSFSTLQANKKHACKDVLANLPFPVSALHLSSSSCFPTSPASTRAEGTAVFGMAGVSAGGASGAAVFGTGGGVFAGGAAAVFGVGGGVFAGGAAAVFGVGGAVFAGGGAAVFGVGGGVFAGGADAVFGVGGGVFAGGAAAVFGVGGAVFAGGGIEDITGAGGRLSGRAAGFWGISFAGGTVLASAGLFSASADA